MPFMWADTLLAAERAQLMRLLVWGGASVLVGTALVAWLRAGARRSELLEHFAIQLIAWGVLDLARAAFAHATLIPRDVAAATRLDRLLWLNIGLDVGYVLVGLTLAFTGWRLGRRFALIGAGMGVIVQGTALTLIDLLLASQISR